MTNFSSGKQITTDVISLFGDKHLNTGDYELDDLFVKSPYYKEDFWKRGGHRDFVTSLSNLLSEDEIASLNKTAELLYKSGMCYFLTNANFDNSYHRFIIVPAQCWIVTVSVLLIIVNDNEFSLKSNIKIGQAMSSDAPCRYLRTIGSSFSSQDLDIPTMATRTKESIIQGLRNNFVQTIREGYFCIRDSAEEEQIRQQFEKSQWDITGIEWLRDCCLLRYC